MKKIKHHFFIIACVLCIFGCKDETVKKLESITKSEQSILDSLDKYKFAQFKMVDSKDTKNKRQNAIDYNNGLYFKMYEAFHGKNKNFCVKGTATTLEGDAIHSYFIVSPGKVIIITDARRDKYRPEKRITKRESDFLKLAQWEMRNNSLADSVLKEVDNNNYNKEKLIIPIFDYNKKLLRAY